MLESRTQRSLYRARCIVMTDSGSTGMWKLIHSKKSKKPSPKGIRHLSCGKTPKALCDATKHMKCMASKTCRLKYQAKLCRENRSCNAKFKIDLEKLKHFKGYYKKVKCDKQKGKAKSKCYWHSLCHACFITRILFMSR